MCLYADFCYGRSSPCVIGWEMVLQKRWSPAVLRGSLPALQGCNLIPDLISSVICKFFPGSTLLALLFVIYLLFFPSGRNLKNLACGVWTETFYVVKWPCQLLNHDAIKNRRKRSQMSRWRWRRGRNQVWHYTAEGFCSHSCCSALKCFFGYYFRLGEAGKKARHYCIITLGKNSFPCVTMLRLPEWCYWQNVPFCCTWKCSPEQKWARHLIAGSFANRRGWNKVTLTVLTNYKGLTFVYYFFFKCQVCILIASSQHSIKRFCGGALIWAEWEGDEDEGMSSRLQMDIFHRHLPVAMKVKKPLI